MVWIWIIAYLVVAALSIFAFGYIDEELSGEDGPRDTVLIDLAAGFFWPLGWTVWAPVLALGWISKKKREAEAPKEKSLKEKLKGGSGCPWAEWKLSPEMSDMRDQCYTCSRCGSLLHVRHGTNPAEVSPYCACGAHMRCREWKAKHEKI